MKARILPTSSSAATALLLLAFSACAGADGTTIPAQPFAGSATKDLFPPTGTTVNSALFPPESKVGFTGPTPTGAEPQAIQDAPLYPFNTGPAGYFPLLKLAPRPDGSNGNASAAFDMTRHWGNLSPWYSVPSSDYGLPNTSPLAPQGCRVTQMHLLYRHGARYPTADAGPAGFAQKVQNATKSHSGLRVSGDLSFLANWTYKLGAELLTPFGRSQVFLLGVAHRQLYGHLLNDYTRAGKLPVFRTQSQDRMVKSAANFAAGFFGVPEYLDQVSIEILVEAPGVNNSGAPSSTCPNGLSDRGNLGKKAAAQYAKGAFNATAQRLQALVQGLELKSSEVLTMLQLCAYETVALGSSPFCPLFTAREFTALETYYDILFYYDNGPGSPTAAAQGKAYLDEFLGRVTGKYPQPNSALNQTFDSSDTFFPLRQALYADATHEVVLLEVLTAFNLSGLWDGPPVSVTGEEKGSRFVASKLVSFATHFAVQGLECEGEEYGGEKKELVRFIVNDAVVPIAHSHPGCTPNDDGLCAFDTVISALQKRSQEIDFEYDCFAEYEAKVGVDYGGRAPRN